MLESLFLPETSLQNDEFPSHIIWDKSEEVEIRVIFPNSIQIKKIYNVPEDGIVHLDNTLLHINKFEENGYLGLVFTSSSYREANFTEHISFEITNKATGQIESREKFIDLFRPELKLINKPDVMTIRYNAKKDSFNFEKIHVKNTGLGTAILFIDIKQSSDIKRDLPDSFIKFVDKYNNDLNDNLKHLCELFPENAGLIKKYLRFLTKPTEINNSMDSKSMFTSLLNKFDENEEFFNQFALALYNAYIKNISLLSEIKSFADYVNSIAEGRVILLNSIEELHFSRSTGQIELIIYMSDLGGHEYKPLKIPPIKFVCDVNTKAELKHYTIPLYQLIEWGN